MQALLDVILPVFLVVGFGYVAVWRGLFSPEGVQGLMKFTQQFAIPCLLFRAISTLDLGQQFEPGLLISYYGASGAGFVAGLLGARYIFGRDWEDSVVIGFACMFANTVLLGLPITERAFGEAALAPNYMIIAFNAPFCYGVGVTAMEIVRNRGGGGITTLKAILNAMFRNALVIAIALGFLVNFTGSTLPLALTDAIELMIRAALPAALFGLGGVLVQYKPEGDMRAILFVCAVSLFMHPALAWGIGQAFDLQSDMFRSLILTSAMAPGINAYVFASIYGRAQRVAASSVLLSTAACVLTAWMWLSLL
ncbi:AEC family transporter [Halocynthiibacter styelae]|uniref:AEC family transporter n=1 Tax=Halocynthiibacter styelae TaxID=2761955 RepID=A0A8J7LUB0_9RHOB|nr:AEC family transporter [Paenihalocynthiibacter styelae]MBI1492592.1 AEC family transporter [Paenihalocynthiibacter styelae]